MKKNIVLLFALLISITGVLAQSPNLIKYQAVVHRPDGNLMKNKNIFMKVSLLKGSSTGTVVYSEKFSSNSTNEYGLYNINIGNGELLSGSFTAINWSDGDIWVKLEIDTLYGTSFQLLSTSQLLTVPYAMYANKAHTVDSITTVPQTLSFNGTSLTISNGNTIDLSSIIPTGSIMPFSGTTAPAGWLLCDGASISISTYQNLYNVIGTSFGWSSTNFNIPDLRGVFLRGANGTRSDSIADPDKNNRIASKTGGATGNNVGSLQMDAFQGHIHDYGGLVANYALGGSPILINYSSNYTGQPTDKPITDGTNGTPRTTSETRSKNIYVNYIIKY